MRANKKGPGFLPDKDDREIVDTYLQAHGSSYADWDKSWEQKKEAAFNKVLLAVLHDNKEGVLMLIQDQSARTAH